MPVDIDFAAVVLMELLGVVSFIAAFLFLRQRRLLRTKQAELLNTLSNGLIREKGDGKCFSSEWVIDNIVYKRKKAFGASPFFLVTVTFLIAFFYFVIGPRIVFDLISLGYTSVIALIGISILLWTDAFEAFSYARAIGKVTAEQMDKEDQSYLELANESLKKAFLRFFSLGIAFAAIGPFIPQIFNGAVYGVVLYTTVIFQASEASFKVLTVLGAVVVLSLSVVMLFILPQWLGRIIIRKGKSLTRRILKRKVEPKSTSESFK